ncbi:hypothetical protein G3N92_01485, partial [Burkholderia sp. Ac-20379]|nr:hypothetical protein [Burkholderia sp. Ac-20379]
ALVVMRDAQPAGAAAAGLAGSPGERVVLGQIANALGIAHPLLTDHGVLGSTHAAHAA